MILHPFHISHLAVMAKGCYPHISVRDLGKELQYWNLSTEEPRTLETAIIANIPPSPPLELSIGQKNRLLVDYYRHCSKNPLFKTSNAANWVIHMLGENVLSTTEPVFPTVELKARLTPDEVMTPTSIFKNPIAPYLET